MVDALVLCCRQCQQEADGVHQRHWHEDFLEVDPLELD